MLLSSHSLGRLRRRTLAIALAGLLAVAATAHAQIVWTVDPKTSLAWWQVSPHLNHLWATTCPADPSWRPGEGRSSGWYVNPKLKPPKTGYGNIEDTVHVPLFPRLTVQPVCPQAVRGEIVVADTVHWRGVVGTIAVLGDALYTGEAMRDVAMHEAMGTMQFPEIQFRLDSLVGATKEADTVLASAVGTFTIRGVRKLTTAAVKAFPDAGGMRVLVKWRIPAVELVELAPKLHYVGLGVSTKIWKDFFMGADLVFRHKGTAAN